MKVLDIDNNFKEIGKSFDTVHGHYWILLHIDEVEKLNDFLTVDENTIDECKSLSQESKINFFNGYIFIVFNVLNYMERIVAPRNWTFF